MVQFKEYGKMDIGLSRMNRIQFSSAIILSPFRLSPSSPSLCCLFGLQRTFPLH